MTKTNNHVHGLKQSLAALWQHVDHKRRVQLGWLIVLMVAASFAEVASLGALLPFLGVITSPEGVFKQKTAQFFIQTLDLQTPNELLAPLTVLFCSVVILAGATRLLLLWSTTRLSYALGADMSMSVYRRTLYQPYLVHVSRNSSELVAGIATKTSGVILHVINPLLIAISSFIILLALLGVLILINPAVSLMTLVGFGAIYIAIFKINKYRLLSNANRISLDTTEVVKSLQEGLGGIRDVLLGGVQEIYCETYQRADLALRRAQGSNYFIANSPRFIIEACGMVLIAWIALNLAQESNDSSKTIVILGVFALGAQRLLPILQQIYHSLTTIKGNEETLRDIVALLDQPMPTQAVHNVKNNGRVRFNHQIELQNIWFRYDMSEQWVLKGIDLTIKKGSRVGFIGTTGSGKSTLLDVVMALLTPSSGSLKIDGADITTANSAQWQLDIAHVPQMIYLMDATIAENIAFGEPPNQIDFARVRDAAQRAQIATTIDSWPQAYETLVGERGIKLSGGQRQRIAIARALYKQADLIVFDEATSALDEATEESLMNAIDSLSSDLTILIIAHRLSTLKGCDVIVNLVDGKIQDFGPYAMLIGNEGQAVAH